MEDDKPSVHRLHYIFLSCGIYFILFVFDNSLFYN